MNRSREAATGAIGRVLAPADSGHGSGPPQTRAPFLVFEVAGQRYGLPVANVVQIVQMVAITRLPKAPEIVMGVIDFRGHVTPVIDMRRRLLAPARPYTLNTPIVIGQLNGRTVGLVVDAVSGVVDLEPGQVQSPDRIFSAEIAPHIEHLAAVARLSDGLLLLLNLETVLSQEEEKTLARAMSRRRRPPKKE